MRNRVLKPICDCRRIVLEVEIDIPDGAPIGSPPLAPQVRTADWRIYSGTMSRNPISYNYPVQIPYFQIPYSKIQLPTNLSITIQGNMPLVCDVFGEEP
jgi:hypothetical protein